MANCWNLIPAIYNHIFASYAATGHDGIQQRLSGWGDTVSPMKFMLLGNIINLTLDPLLIFGLASFSRTGYSGCGVGNGQGAVCCMGISNVLPASANTAKIALFFRLDRAIIGVFQGRVARTVSQMLTSVAMMFVFYVLNPFGSDARAAYTIVFTYEMVIFLPAIGISQAVSILTGHNFGAGHFERVNKVYFTGIGVAFSIMAFSALIIIVFSTFFAGIFAQSPEVLKISAHALRITAIGHFFSGIYLCSAASFQGLGLGRHYLAANLVRLYLLQVPLAFFGAKFFGLEGVWYGLMAVNIISGLVLFIWHQYIYRLQVVTGQIQPL
ncbi:MAG: MATE family efflux transporter [Calditrichia bacterium]